MELNADFSQRAVVHAARVPWVASPMPGVERRMLDRIGDEVARATSIVRYAPGSHFPAHTHGGGEEFFVLDGVFQDEHGDYPAGSYVRNPPTSSHVTGSDQGCVIFVKLWQFAADDRRHVCIDTGHMSFVPAHDRAGIEVMPLFRDSREQVSLERWAPDAEIVSAAHDGSEILVLDGEFTDEVERFSAHSWLRMPPRSTLRIKAGSAGCKVWIKSGHLSSQ
jgi:anti-sigma factor ChrR (cupin superfamily)